MRSCDISGLSAVKKHSYSTPDVTENLYPTISCLTISKFMIPKIHLHPVASRKPRTSRSGYKVLRWYHFAALQSLETRSKLETHQPRIVYLSHSSLCSISRLSVSIEPSSPITPPPLCPTGTQAASVSIPCGSAVAGGFWPPILSDRSATNLCQLRP